jgi:hypothetical protein
VTLKYQTFLIAGTERSATRLRSAERARDGLHKRRSLALGGSAKVGTRRFIDRLITEAFDVRPPTFILSNNLSLVAITGVVASGRAASAARPAAKTWMATRR